MSQFDGNRYMEYRAYLSTTDSASTPVLKDVTLCFTDACIPPPTPTLTPDGPATFCAGASVTLTSSSASGNQWYLTGNPIGGATVQQYVATASGDYTDVVTNANSCSSTASASQTVTVNPLPAIPTITPDGPTTFFAGGSVTLTSSSASGNQWYLNGNPIGGATNQQYIATASGDYVVSATSTGCTSTASAATTVTVNSPPDLAITQTDGVTKVAAGGSTTYTITASNGGLADATGATVADTFPAALTCTWTCTGADGATCTAAGSGNIDDSVNLPNGAHLTYTASCTISGAATGTLSNTATVTQQIGAIDPLPGNNSATDTDTLLPQVDVVLAMSDYRDVAESGKTVNYIISVSNSAGPSAVSAIVTDALPAGLSDASWVCIPFGGATCANGSGSTLSDNVTLPAGSQTSYVYSATVMTGDADDLLINTASVALTNGVDPTPGNNSATDTDLVVISMDGFEGTLVTIPAEVGAGADYVTATVRFDASLLSTLSIVPAEVASGRGADGRLLFTLELARFGNATDLRVVTTDDRGVSHRSSWQVVDLDQSLLAFGWQSSSVSDTDGYLSVSTSGSSLVFANLGEPGALTQLWVTVQNMAPWLLLIAR